MGSILIGAQRAQQGLCCGSQQNGSNGVGEDIQICELALLVGEVVGFAGELVFDRDKPDGTPRKLLDVGRLKALGWSARTGLREGVKETYRWYLENIDSLQG